MRTFVFLLLALPLVIFGQTSHTIYASDYQIFSPDVLTINLGDTVYFENLIMHDAVEVDESTYNNNGTASNGGFSLNSDGYIVLEEVGTHFYVCTPHVLNGMKGKIIVEGEPNSSTHTINDYVIELSDLATVSDFYQNTYYNALEQCNVSWQIVQSDMPDEWDFSICFPNCYNPGIVNGTANFGAGTEQYLNCHFYPNNVAGQGVVKMEIVTNSSIIDTVTWIGTATEATSIDHFLLLNKEEIESIYTLEGKKLDLIEPNTAVIIRYKSGLLQRLYLVE